MARIIILAAGEATRWQNHTGMPKHLVDVGGEPLLHRTIRQFSEHGEIIITAPVGDDRYNISGTEIYHPEKAEHLQDAKKLLDNSHLWSESSKTIVLWGDCFFSNKAVKRIATHKPSQWAMYGRFGRSSITGCEYGELFAMAFQPNMRHKIEISLHTIAILKKYKIIGRCGGWELYRHLSNATDLERHARYRNFVEINDTTEDFDFPHDYDRWVERVLNKNKHMD